MATETVQTQIEGKIDLLDLVYTEATWKDLLIELVNKNRLDPWDIDIVEVVDKYIGTVKQMKVLELRVPANIILASAILLRFKSNLLTVEEQEQLPEAETVLQRPEVAVGQLAFRMRLPPKRKVTLQELIGALEEAIQIKETKQAASQRHVEIPLVINDIDIEAETEKLHKEIVKHADKSKMITLGSLLSITGTEDPLLGMFIPLLFLAHQEKITLIQERFFEEIIIALR